MQIPNYNKGCSLFLGTLAVFLGASIQLFASNAVVKDTLFVAKGTIIYAATNLPSPTIFVSNQPKPSSNNYLFVKADTLTQGLESIEAVAPDSSINNKTISTGSFFAVKDTASPGVELVCSANSIKTITAFQKNKLLYKHTNAHNSLAKNETAKTESSKIIALPRESQSGNRFGLLSHIGFALLFNSSVENYTKDKVAYCNYFSTIYQDSVQPLEEESNNCLFANNSPFANTATLSGSIWPNAPPA